MRLRPLPLLLALPSALAWSCSEVGTDKGVLDLSPLAGAKVATTEMETPPTKNIARVRLDLCGTLQKEDGVKDEDQVGAGAGWRCRCSAWWLNGGGGHGRRESWRAQDHDRRESRRAQSHVCPQHLRGASCLEAADACRALHINHRLYSKPTTPPPLRLSLHCR